MPYELEGVVVAVPWVATRAGDAVRALANEGATVVSTGGEPSSAGRMIAEVESDARGRAVYCATDDRELLAAFAAEQFGRLDTTLDDPSGDRRDVDRVRQAARRS
jgi:hypothetical protein